MGAKYATRTPVRKKIKTDARTATADHVLHNSWKDHLARDRCLNLSTFSALSFLYLLFAIINTIYMEWYGDDDTGTPPVLMGGPAVGRLRRVKDRKERTREH